MDSICRSNHRNVGFGKVSFDRNENVSNDSTGVSFFSFFSINKDEIDQRIQAQRDLFSRVYPSREYHQVIIFQMESMYKQLGFIPT